MKRNKPVIGRLELKAKAVLEVKVALRTACRGQHQLKQDAWNLPGEHRQHVEPSW